MNDIHKRGGTILGTSRGGHDTSKIVDSIEDRGINQVKAATSGHKSLSGSQSHTNLSHFLVVLQMDTSYLNLQSSTLEKLTKNCYVLSMHRSTSLGVMALKEEQM